MPEIALTPPPPRSELLRQVSGHIRDLVPRGQLLAVGIQGAESPIDFVVLEPGGSLVLVLVADPGHDLEQVGLALAQRAWVEARLHDWLQLAPDLGVRPEAGVRVCLLCASLRPETLAAARPLGTGVLELAIYRCIRTREGAGLLVERLERPAAAMPQAPAVEPTAEPAETPVPLPSFRTGLRDIDLGITAEERAGLE